MKCPFCFPTAALGRLVLFVSFFLGATGRSAAATSTNTWLPPDTLLYVSVRDAARLSAMQTNGMIRPFWTDPAMNPFTDKLRNKILTNLLQPLERQLGISFSDYTRIAQGQVVIGLSKNGWPESQNVPALFLSLDTKEKSSALTNQLARLKNSWLAAGKRVQIRDFMGLDCVTLRLSEEEIIKGLGESFGHRTLLTNAVTNKSTNTKDVEFSFVQRGSLFLAATSSKLLEQLVAAYAKSPQLDVAWRGQVETVGEPFDIWVALNAKAVLSVVLQKSKKKKSNSDPGLPSLATFVGGLGLNEWESFSFGYRQEKDGEFFRVAASGSTSNRQGPFTLLIADRKDTSPPVFVPSRVVSFFRMRVDLKKAWGTLEAMLSKTLPGATGALKLMFDYAGKDRDPNFDVRRELIGNLGDDFVIYETKMATETKDKSEPLFLVGSPFPERLATAVKLVYLSLGPSGSSSQEHFVFSNKVVSLFLPGTTSGNTNTPAAVLYFAAATNYLALSKSAITLENFLRSGVSNEPLRNARSYDYGIKKIGSGKDGFFSFSDQKEKMSERFTTLRNANVFLDSVLSPGIFLGLAPDKERFSDWLDFKLLPPFAAVQRHFSFSVSTGGSDAQGFYWNFFFPASAGSHSVK